MTRARRGNQEGSVYQRKRDGKWCGVVSLGRDAAGKWLRRTVTANTKREALDRLRELQASTGTALPTSPASMTIGEVAERWLRDVIQPNKRANTYASYETTWRVHVKGRLGHTRILAIRPLHIEAFYAELERGGISGRTRENVHLVLSRVLEQAVRWQMLATNPARAVTPPQREDVEMTVWTREQAQAFLRVALADRLGALYVCAIATGLRQGELFGWQWKDLDLDNARGQVQRTLVEVRGKLSLGPPKTRAGARAVDLPAVAVRALAAHREAMRLEGHEVTGEAHVFVDTEGGLLRKSNVRRRNYAPLLAKAELPVITFQDLRHTCATLLLSMNTHPKVVSERLGHTDVKVTLDVYSHVLPGLQAEASALLDRALDPGDEAPSVAVRLLSEPRKARSPKRKKPPEP